MAEVEKKVSPYEALRRRYPLAEYALLSEVSNMPGHSRSRSADYVLMNLWPSRGNAIIGIEQKASRSDWLSELKKPEKAESIFKYCDYFNLYTTDEKIAKLEEIPDAWGWITLKGSRIVTMKEAPKQAPVALTKGFVACMLKRACGNTELIHPSSLEDKIKEEATKLALQNTRDAASIKTELTDLQRDIQIFEDASGIRLASKWNWQDNKKIGEAVKFVMNNGIESYKKQLERLQFTAKGIHDHIEGTLSRVKEQNDELCDATVDA